MKSKFFKNLFYILIITIGFGTEIIGQSVNPYDIVLMGGRVIDPETKLDAIRNIGIIGSRIVQISSEPLKGKEMIDVSGLVVAPGFIDMHVHGRSNIEQEYQLHDGVTTALELEWGIQFLDEWYASREKKALINYGGSVCWPFERYKALDEYKDKLSELRQKSANEFNGVIPLVNYLSPSFKANLSQPQMSKTLENIRLSLAAGGIGIGVPIGYLPDVIAEEVFRVYQFAGDNKVPIFTHVREGGIMAVQQAIADAVLTGAPLHIVHINSATLGQISLAVEMVQRARDAGFDVSTELYPYTAASTGLQTALFDEGWQQRLGISYGDLQWVETGERLNKETFDTYRKTGGVVIIHSMKPEWIKAGIAAPGVMVASDGMGYAKLAHPRTAGTFSRVLGKYVREDKVIDLNMALEKITLLPAKRLESVAPMMRFKGRIQIGADADITIFNPNTVIDKASFETGLAFSDGIQYVLVNGTVALRDGKTIKNTYPGQAIYGKYKK